MEVYGALNAKQAKSIHSIEESGRHLLNLINDILDLSKIEAGKLELELSDVNVDDLCQAGLRMIKQMAATKEQSVTYALHPTGLTIRADTRRLKQAIVNLLSNAVKFTPERGELGLLVEADRTRRAIYFTVWDNGIGIAPEATGRLFKPFVQLDSSLARSEGGTGLGLSLVQRLVELHGGSVALESTPGKAAVLPLRFHGLKHPGSCWSDRVSPPTSAPPLLPYWFWTIHRPRSIWWPAICTNLVCTRSSSRPRLKAQWNGYAPRNRRQSSSISSCMTGVVGTFCAS
ncbi:MAG: HAMP domain-containing histidine kinase [Anaerolineales bacterium]|nr:HAMP domain-containing histidine kinase [Anaerolineales bacterium]